MIKKVITQVEMEAVLQAVYQTNISAQAFDGLKKLFSSLENAPIELPAEFKSDENQKTTA